MTRAQAFAHWQTTNLTSHNQAPPPPPPPRACPHGQGRAAIDLAHHSHEARGCSVDRTSEQALPPPAPGRAHGKRFLASGLAKLAVPKAKGHAHGQAFRQASISAAQAPPF